MGSLELSTNEIMLFGGFSDGPVDRVLYYKPTEGQTDEGTITTTSNVRLAVKDFFVVSGITIKVPEALSEGRRQVIIAGHNGQHCYDMDQRTFRALQ
jgi:hypothetical protein